MPSKKKNHFVPQFYLRNFGSEHSISLYNIAKRLYVPVASIPNQCQRPYLYGRTSALEDALQTLEGRVSGIIQSIIQTKSMPDKESFEYVELMLFISFQMHRTPLAGQESLKAMTKMMRAQFRNNPKFPAHLKDKLDGVRLNHENPVLFTLASMGPFGYLLHDLKPVLIQNESSVGFVASDSPVVKFNQWGQDVTHCGVLGLVCSGLQVFLPLSKELLLLLYDDRIYSTKDIIRVSTQYSVHGLNSLQLTAPITNLYFDGTATTLEAIKKLPFEWWTRSQDLDRIVEAESERNPSTLIHGFREIVGRLAIPEIHLKKAAKEVLTWDRGSSHRQEALAAMRLLDSARYERFRKEPDRFRIRRKS